MKLASLAGHIVELAHQAESGLVNHAEGNKKTVRAAQSVEPADRIVAEFFRSRKYLGSHDRRFISQAVYGIIRFRRRLNVLLEQFYTEHPAIAQPTSQQAVEFLQLIAYMAAVEEFDPQQIIGQLQERWPGDVPNIELQQVTYWMVQNKSLGFLRGDDVRQLADWYSFEEWIVHECVDLFGQDEAEDLLHALNSEAPMTLRVNRLKTSVEQCQSRLLQEGVETSRTRYSPTGLIASKRFNAQASQAFKEGMFEIQDEGSQVICHLAEPKPGEFVIDACAGAGGKTLLLAELMKNKGEILAFDIDRKRLEELTKRASRAGVSIIVTQRPDQLHPGNLLGKADLVLIDAPCTGVGTIRRNPAFKWSVTPERVEYYAQKQFVILDSYASYVRGGGRLVYATCSLIRHENEYIAEKFLERHPEFEAVLPKGVLDQLALSSDSSFLKLLPHRHGTDGFFVAIFKKME